MDPFVSWSLDARIQIELKPFEDFTRQKGQEEFLSIFMTTDSEIDKSSDIFAKSIQLYGEFKSGSMYFFDNTGKKAFYVAQTCGPKKLSSQKPGKAHLASNLGASFYNAMHQFVKESFYFSKTNEIYINFSYEMRKIIEGEDYEFFLGILQRSVNCKVKKSTHNLQTVKKLVFREDIFTLESVKKANSISSAMCTTRTLINMPANELNPETYESILNNILRQKFSHLILPDNVVIETYDYERLLQENCNLICAVGQGSVHKPRIIKLSYSPHDETNSLKHVCLVGKGITFDTGGYDIKSSGGMRMMKKDMAGSAASLGIFLSCIMQNLPVKLTCYLAIAENMVSGNAMRPGDIYKTRNGLNVEIENTDAEGRLVLADAISLACEEKPDWLINLATLTGAARVSLGPLIDSAFGNNKSMNDLLYFTGIENGDWVWPMPLVPDYESYLDSSVADIMNSSSGSFAGSVTAALFLQKFVTVEKWNHIDTYMWAEKPFYLWQDGAAPTAKCVRLVTRAIEKFLSKEENEQ